MDIPLDFRSGANDRLLFRHDLNKTDHISVGLALTNQNQLAVHVQLMRKLHASSFPSTYFCQVDSEKLWREASAGRGGTSADSLPVSALMTAVDLLFPLPLDEAGGEQAREQVLTNLVAKSHVTLSASKDFDSKAIATSVTVASKVALQPLNTNKLISKGSLRQLWLTLPVAGDQGCTRPGSVGL